MTSLVTKYLPKLTLLLPLLAVLFSMAVWDTPTVSAQSSPCQTSADKRVNNVNCLRLTGRYYGPGPGQGVEAESVLGRLSEEQLGAYITSASVSGNVLTLTGQDDSGNDVTITFTAVAGTGDGVVTAGAFDLPNDNLDLTVTTGGTTSTVSITVPAALSAGATLSDDDPEDIVITGAAEGASGEVSRADHVHAGDRQRALGTHIPESIAATGSVGTNTTVSHSDHVHGGQRAFETAAPEDVTTGTGSVGTSDLLSRADHQHGGDTNTQLSFGTGIPSEVIAGAGSAGSAITASRFDHQHGGDDNSHLAFGTDTPADVTTGTGAVGTATTASRSDHQHGGDTDTILALSDSVTNVASASSFGTAATASRGDHTHGGARIHVASGAATQNQRNFTLPTVVPPLPGNPPVGTVLVWKTPTSVSDQTLDGVFLVVGSISYIMARPPNHLINTSELLEDTPYAVIYDGSQFKTADNLLSVPPDGDTGDVLTKSSDTDWDYGWSAQTGQTATQVTNSINSLVDSWARTNSADTVPGTVITASTIDGTKILDGTIGSDDLHAEVSDCLVPTGGTTTQVLVKTNNNRCETRWQTFGGVTQTFLALTDTPAGYASNERYLVRVNAAGTALEFIDEPPPANAISVVGRIPSATADSADVIYLTHDYTVGDREDVTLTVGFSSPYAGYSGGLDLPAFGSIETASPLENFVGAGASGNYALSTIASQNQHWIDSLTSVEIDDVAYTLSTSFLDQGFWERALVSPPSGLSGASVEVNFEVGDGIWQFSTNEHTVRSGLYEKILTGAGHYTYNRLSIGEFHIDSILPPTEPPEFAGQLYVSNEGKLWVAGDEVITTTTDPSITHIQFTSTFWNTTAASCTLFSDGQFTAAFAGGFVQRQGTSCPSVSWLEIWTYIAASVENTAAIRNLRDNTVFLGEYETNVDEDAALARQSQTDNSKTYYFVDASGLPHDIRLITAFTAGATTSTDHFFWRGPLTVAEDVLDVIDTVLIRPDSTGHLPAPTADEYDATHAQSRVVGFDGYWWKVGRNLIAGHTASATYAEVAELDTITTDGHSYRYRGEHWQDYLVNSPQINDFYYNLTSHEFRLYHDNTRFFEPNSFDAISATSRLARYLNFVDFFDTQAEATAHVSAVGQHVIYSTATNVYGLYRVTAYTAALADHYEYFWKKLIPDPVAPQNVVLVDDATYGWSVANGPSQEVHFSRELFGAEDGQLINVDWRVWSGSDPGGNYRRAGTAILAEHIRRLTTLAPLDLAKSGGLGGRDPINRGVAITDANVSGAVEFKMEAGSTGHALYDMRLIYIGDHVDDVDESLDSSDTVITLDSSADVTAGQTYWIVGPVSGAGCTPTRHSEQVTIVSVSADDVTVTRGIGGTSLDSDCSFDPGADFIHDNKRYFTLQSRHADQDDAAVTFTLFPAGSVGGIGGGLDAGSVTLDVGSFNGQLSASDTSVQSALDTLDDSRYSFGAILAAGTTISANEPFGTGGWENSLAIGIVETRRDISGFHDDVPTYSGFATGPYKLTIIKEPSQMITTQFCVSKSTTQPHNSPTFVDATARVHASGDFDDHIDETIQWFTPSDHVWLYNCGMAIQNGPQIEMAIVPLGR